MFFKALALFTFFLASAVQSGPSEELFEKLKNAEGEREVALAEADVLAAWMDSGSATVDLIMSRADEAVAAGDMEHARALYDRAILIKPDFPEAWNRRAALFLADDKFDEALRDLNEVLTLEPRHFGAWTGLGFIMEQLGAEKEALEAFEEALKIHPNLQAAKQSAAKLKPKTSGQAL